MCFSEDYEPMSNIAWTPNMSLHERQSIWEWLGRGIRIENQLDTHIVADESDIHPSGAILPDLAVPDGGYKLKGCVSLYVQCFKQDKEHCSPPRRPQ